MEGAFIQLSKIISCRTILEHWRVLVFASLALIVFALYSSVFFVGLINDDFIEVGARYFDAQDSLKQPDLGLWVNRFVERSLIDPVTDNQIFRPWRQAIFVADYFMWGLTPFGYHLTNVLIYILLCWVVVLLAWRLTRGRLAAALAGLLYAVYTVHSAPVDSISSRGHLLAALFVGLCVLFYILPRTRFHLTMSWLMCALAIGSKETAWATPALLLTYELIYHRDEIRRNPVGLVRRQALFWLLPLAVIVIRLLTSGQNVQGPFQLGTSDWLYQLEGYTLFALRPFVFDLNELQTAVILIGLGLLGVLYRARREIVFGLLWVPVMMPVTIFFPPTERYFATPSIGLVLALAFILARPVDANLRLAKPMRVAGLVTFAVLAIVFSIGTLNRNNDYLDLSNLTEHTLSRLKSLEPTLPRKSTLTFVGLSAFARGGILFLTARQLQYAVQLLYRDRSLRVTMVDNFPSTVNLPKNSFFFEYGQHQLTERADLVAATRNRLRCADSPDKTIRWDFYNGAEGWEPWSQIADLVPKSPVLRFRTTGNDAFFGGPYIQVSLQELEKVQVTMRVQAAAPTIRAQLYWQTADQNDFSDYARTAFQVTADNASHTYDVALDAHGSAPIIRLRFDPSDTPAEIQLESITIYCR